MSTQPKLSLGEYATIKAHNDSLMFAAENAIQSIRETPARDRTYMAKNMLLYWQDVVKALKWSTQIAAQKARIAHNAGPDIL